MFADATKLYRIITSESDCDILQRDLNNVMDRGRKWLTNNLNPYYIKNMLSIVAN